MSAASGDVYRVGLDIGGTKTVLAVLAAGAQVLAANRLSSLRLLNTAQPVQALAEAIRTLCGRAGVPLSKIEGVGIGVPGISNPSTGVIALCNNLPVLNHLPLGPHLAGELGIPVFVDNDVNLITLGEHLAGRAQGVDDVVCVFVGSGIGCGMILNGRLYRGADGVAGEVGHTILVPGGRPCNCGLHGCLEMYCSGKALALQAESILRAEGGDGAKQRGIDWTAQIDWAKAEPVIGAGRAGHPRARACLEEAFHYLGMGVANIVSALNPRLLILGGGIVTAWPDSLDIVRSDVTRLALRECSRSLLIDGPLLGETAGLVGAFSWWERICEWDNLGDGSSLITLYSEEV